MNNLIPRGFSMLNFKKLITGSLLAVALSAVLLMAAAFCVKKVGLPSDAVAGTLGLAAGAVAVFAGSVVTAMWAGEKGLLYGVLLSVLVSAVYIAVGVFVCNEIEYAAVSVRVAAFLVSGALGGVLGVNRTQHIRF